MVVIVGTFAVRLMTTGWETPDPQVVWNTTALFIRSSGWCLLGFPAIWAIMSLVLERRPEGTWTVGWTITSGVLIFVALVVVYLNLMFNAFHLI